MNQMWILLLGLFSLSAFSKTILILGDSLTEGYHLPQEEAYPSLVETALKKNHPDVKVINGGVSGATSASGMKRLEWFLKAQPEMMVLALGANDGLRGLDLKQTEKNLSAVIKKAQENKIKVILAGMKMPTNYGEPYRTQFEEIYPNLAKLYEIKLIPFLLKGVAGHPELNLPDGIHPNAKGYKIIAETVVKYLEPEL